MTTKDFDSGLLALQGWREGHKEGAQVALYVAYTIHNLAKSKDISIGEAVVLHRAMHFLPAMEDEFPDCRDPQFTRLLQRIDQVTAEFAEDPTNGAIYYAELSNGAPEYIKPILADSERHPMCAISGTRHFFK